MDLFYSLAGFFITGGPFMYPILIVFAVGTAIAVERYITLNTVTNQNQSMWNKLQPALHLRPGEQRVARLHDADVT